MGKKSDDGGMGLFGYLVIILLIAFAVDYIGMFNVPVIHSIDDKFVHPALDPKVMPYLEKFGIVKPFPTTLEAINNAEVDNAHSVVNGQFTSVVTGETTTLSGHFETSGKVIEGLRIGVAEIVTVKLLPPNPAIQTKLGSDYEDYVKLYNETGGSIVLIYYNDDVPYKVIASANASLRFGNTTLLAGGNAVTIESATLKLAHTEGYKYYVEFEKFRGRIPVTATAQLVIFDRVANKWEKMGTVPVAVRM